MEEIKDTLVYDLQTLPEGLDINKMIYIVKHHNLVIYDSSNGGNEPRVLNKIDSNYLTVEVKNLTDKQKEILKCLQD